MPLRLPHAGCSSHGGPPRLLRSFAKLWIQFTEMPMKLGKVSVKESLRWRGSLLPPGLRQGAFTSLARFRQVSWPTRVPTTMSSGQFLQLRAGPGFSDFSWGCKTLSQPRACLHTSQAQGPAVMLRGCEICVAPKAPFNGC
jgi:hypothetical protein